MDCQQTAKYSQDFVASTQSKSIEGQTNRGLFYWPNHSGEIWLAKHLAQNLKSYIFKTPQFWVVPLAKVWPQIKMLNELKVCRIRFHGSLSYVKMPKSPTLKNPSGTHPFRSQYLCGPTPKIRILLPMFLALALRFPKMYVHVGFLKLREDIDFEEKRNLWPKAAPWGQFHELKLG